jgi:hypothetical protein
MAVNNEINYSPNNLIELKDIRGKSGSALEPPPKKTAIIF